MQLGTMHFIHHIVKVLGEPVLRRCHTRVKSQVLRVDSIEIRQSKRPSTALTDSNALDVESGERAGSERRIFEEIALENFFYGYDRLRGGVRHRCQLALAADPHIAEAGGPPRLGGRNVQPDPRGEDKSNTR